MNALRHAISNYPFKRLAAWILDLIFVTFISTFAFGSLIVSSAPQEAFLVSVGSAIVGFTYFLAFSLTASRTPGLMIVRGSLSSSKPGSLAGAGIFASMLLPFGAALLVLDPALDVFGSLGVEVRV